MSVFGRSYVNGAPATPGMARIDPETGREVERIDLPYLEGNGYWWMAFSDDGRTARITCRVAEPCTADGWMSATIDFATGAVIETDPPESWPDDPLHIDPPDAVPDGEGRHLRAVLGAAHGERKVAIWGRGEMELYDADDARIARLSDGRHFHVGFIDHVNAVSVSPSGDMIAALFPTATMAPALLRLWSAGDGAPLAEIELPYRYSGSYAPAWPDGSDMVALVRTIEHRPDNSATATSVDTVIDFYRVPVED